MPAQMLLCTSQKLSSFYIFKYTNIKVYSLEEALYHCYHYWKESLDDFISQDFVDWVKDDLQMSFIASRIKEIIHYDSLSERLIKFLCIIDYFNEREILEIRGRLSEWEKRLEWEKLKDRGDYFNNMNQPAKAYPSLRGIEGLIALSLCKTVCRSIAGALS